MMENQGFDDILVYADEGNVLGMKAYIGLTYLIDSRTKSLFKSIINEVFFKSKQTYAPKKITTHHEFQIMNRN